MIGELPTSIEIGGEEWKIRSDFRNILRIFEAMEDQELSDAEKLYVSLYRFYVDFESMPQEIYQEAYNKEFAFIECHDRSDEKSKPKLVNWEKDEQMIFPAINAVAGLEVRSVEYMHWWTFMGYFENVDNEGLWSFVLSIRQKKSKGKKLEKYEEEFYRNNMALCDVRKRSEMLKPEDDLAKMFDMLSNE